MSRWQITHNGVPRTIELHQGDLSRLPPEQAVDLLVVSAFTDDYIPTSSSLIGALHRIGLSVADLADRKAVDLRDQFSCWVSQPLPEQFPYRRLLCIESGWRGNPPEITDDLFRALAPYILTECPNASVAMPIIGAGDQGWPPGQMLTSILDSAVAWIHRGLPLNLLKIVAYSQGTADIACRAFQTIRDEHSALENEQRAGSTQTESARANLWKYDVFVSYCHEDLEAANILKRKLEAIRPRTRIFFDRSTLNTGASWLMQVAESLDDSHRVVALYTPRYWASPSCKDEFIAALARQNDIGDAVLFPVYFSTAKIPYLFRNLQFVDCRERDVKKLEDAGSELMQKL